MKKSNRKQTGSWFAGRPSLIMGMGGALLVILLSVNFLSNDTPDRAHIVRVSGTVSIERSGEKIIPVIGMFLNAQDKIITGTGSFIEIAYDDSLKDVMHVGANSRVVLESAGIEKLTNIFMDKGEVKIKLDKLEKGSTFKVRTPVAIAGVRGTAFGVQFKGKQVVITDYESRIFVKGLTEDFLEMKDELLLNDGWKVEVAQFEKPSRVERLTLSEHDAWKAWLKEINSLSVSPSVTLTPRTDLASGWESFLQQHLTALRMITRQITASVTTSVSALALMLYAVLAMGMGRVAEKVLA